MAALIVVLSVLLAWTALDAWYWRRKYSALVDVVIKSYQSESGVADESSSLDFDGAGLALLHDAVSRKIEQAVRGLRGRRLS